MEMVVVVEIAWGGCCTWSGDNDQVIPREEKLYR